jgi:hypothetical protein
MSQKNTLNEFSVAKLALFIMLMVLAIVTGYLSDNRLSLTELHYCSLISIINFIINNFSEISLVFSAMFVWMFFANDWLNKFTSIACYLSSLITTIFYQTILVGNSSLHIYKNIANPILSSPILQAMDCSAAIIPEI